MLIKCPECEKQISDKAEHCPYCGNVMPVIIRLRWDGGMAFPVINFSVKVSCDDFYIGAGPLREGGNVQWNTKVGVHEITVKFGINSPRFYRINFENPGFYDVLLKWSKIAGNFNEYDIKRL